MANRMGRSGSCGRFYFLWLKNHCEPWLQPWIYKTLVLCRESYDKPRQCIKRQKHHFADKDPYSQSYGFSSSFVWMWELDHKECWAPKNWCFRIVLEKSLESPLDTRRSNQSTLKEMNPENSLEGLMLKLKCQQFGQLIGKVPDAGKNWGQKGKRASEDEMARWHH